MDAQHTGPLKITTFTCIILFMVFLIGLTFNSLFFDQTQNSQIYNNGLTNPLNNSEPFDTACIRDSLNILPDTSALKENAQNLFEMSGIQLYIITDELSQGETPLTHLQNKFPQIINNPYGLIFMISQVNEVCRWDYVVTTDVSRVLQTDTLDHFNTRIFQQPNMETLLSQELMNTIHELKLKQLEQNDSKPSAAWFAVPFVLCALSMFIIDIICYVYAIQPRPEFPEF